VYKCFAVSLSVSLCASKNLIQGLQHFIGACCLVFQTLAHPLIRATHGKRILHAIQSIFLFIPNLFVMWTVCGRRIRRLMRMDDVAQVFHFSLLHSLLFFFASQICAGRRWSVLHFGSSLFADYNDATYCFYYTLLCVRCWSDFNVGFPQSTYTKLEYHKWTTERILCIFVSQFYRIKADWAVSIKLIVIALFRNWK